MGKRNSKISVKKVRVAGCKDLGNHDNKRILLYFKDSSFYPYQFSMSFQYFSEFFGINNDEYVDNISGRIVYIAVNSGRNIIDIGNNKSVLESRVKDLIKHSKTEPPKKKKQIKKTKLVEKLSKEEKEKRWRAYEQDAFFSRVMSGFPEPESEVIEGRRRLYLRD